MFLRETTRKNKDGSTVTYLQLTVSEWDKSKHRAVNKVIYSFGRADDPAVKERLRRLARSILRRCSPEEIIADDPSWKVINAWPYGPVHVLEGLWRRLGIADVVNRQAAGSKLEFDVERALFAMVANRACAPCSKLYCHERWLREDVRIEGTRELELHHLYRAMDWLDENTQQIEKEIFFRVSDLLHLDVELIFYDTTSLHFEVDEEDVGISAGNGEGGSEQAAGDDGHALRKRGYSKNKRQDAPQIVVGLAVTRDGIPVRHWIFPGNTVDVTTVERVKKDLSGWKLIRCVFVGDAGMVSEENLKKLALGGGKYIVCMPIVRGGEVARDVLTRRGRYQKVAQNLRVKEVVVGDGERRRRYVVCHNPEEEARRRRHRQRVLQELEAELASITDCAPGEQHSRRACALRPSKRYGRYLRMLKNGRLVIDKGAVKRAARYDGKFVVHSNDDTLSAEDMALGYKQLMRVERAWRDMKSVLQMRPVYHWAPHRIRAHVGLTFMSLLLQRVAENACGDSWRNILDDLGQVKLVQLSGPHGQLWQVTEPSEGARNRLKSLKIENPPLIINHA